MIEVTRLPEAWLVDATEEEKARYNREVDIEVNNILRERGFELPKEALVDEDTSVDLFMRKTLGEELYNWSNRMNSGNNG